MPEPILDQPGIMARVGHRIAAGMVVQHVGAPNRCTVSATVFW
jgi:hypothetical protein